MRVLKAFCVLAAVFFLAIAVGSATNNDVYAGGGINYTVTVRNPTDSKCRVCLYVSKGGNYPFGNDIYISPGGSHTWETGALCPCGLVGDFWDKDSKAWRKIQDTNCLGNATSYHWFSACCWSLKFKVCRKKGAEYTDIRDNDYGFCKE